MGYSRSSIATTGALPPGAQLIQDSFVFERIGKPTLVKESANFQGKPTMRVQGLFQQADKKNANLRVYPYAILRNAVDNIQEDIKARGVIGELNHPDSARINLDRVSHVITKLWMDGKKVYGEAEVLDEMPCGSMLRTLFEHNIRNGISSRGVGDMEMRESHGEETYYVSEGFSFVTWDAVADPSVGNAYLTIVENRDRMLRNGNAKFTTQRTSKKFSDEAYNAQLKQAFLETLRK